MAEPLVSLGMPVRQAERFVAQSIAALRQQEFGDFELLISDNASEDGSAKICQFYADQDDRIRFHRQERNIGAAANFNWLLDNATGKYFAWTADHDLWGRTWLGACVEILESSPNVVLAQSATAIIDAENRFLGVTPDRYDTRGLAPLVRYSMLLWELSFCNIVYGLFRRKECSELTTRHRTAFGMDHAMLAEMSLKGEFAHFSGPLYLRRQNRAAEREDERRQRILRDLDPSTAEQRSRSTPVELFRELRDVHLDMLESGSLSDDERQRAKAETLRCFQHRWGVPIQ